MVLCIPENWHTPLSTQIFWPNDVFSHSSHIVLHAVCFSAMTLLCPSLTCSLSSLLWNNPPYCSIHTVTRRLPSLHAVTHQLSFQRSEQNCFSHFQFNRSLLTDVNMSVNMSPKAARTAHSNGSSHIKSYSDSIVDQSHIQPIWILTFRMSSIS